MLSGEDPSFNSVGERNPWSRSFKQCVFTDPEGEVGEVTRGLALEGSGPFRYSCKLTKKDVRIQAGYHSKYSSDTSNVFMFTVVGFFVAYFSLLQE